MDAEGERENRKHWPTGRMYLWDAFHSHVAATLYTWPDGLDWTLDHTWPHSLVQKQSRRKMVFVRRRARIRWTKCGNSPLVSPRIASRPEHPNNIFLYSSFLVSLLKFVLNLFIKTSLCLCFLKCFIFSLSKSCCCIWTITRSALKDILWKALLLLRLWVY